MRSLGYHRWAVMFSAAVLMSGCEGSQTAEPSPLQYIPKAEAGQDRARSPLHYAVLYSFGRPPDGHGPQAALLNLSGTLYGTTVYGGSRCSHGGCGTVFSLTTAGKERVLHDFAGGNDGAYPFAGMISVNGALYGTTSEGGSGSGCSYGCGTVFTITTSGRERVIHSFAYNGADGSDPLAGLIYANGTLYGTTGAGGSSSMCTYGCGTVFSITPDGKEKILHSFGSGPDGAQPEAGLIELNGVLYGTTVYGGSQCSSSGGCGTVFSVTPAGKEKVLHSFAGGSDGEYPLAGLIAAKATLYGTTAGGGSATGCTYGCGTAFAITAHGTEKVLYSFGGGNDGADPEAGLINVHGTLYGTTAVGGKSGAGTVFSITTGGVEKVLHNFVYKKADGNLPKAGLVNVSGTLYGTTVFGGVHRGVLAGGTVFALTP